MVTEFYPPQRGGLEFHVEHLTLELTRRGHDVQVATLGPENGTTVQAGVVVHHIRSSASRLKLLHADPSRPFHLPVSDVEVRYHLGRVVRSFRPDVVHAHNWMIASLPRGMAPLVLTSHDYAWACPKRTLLRPNGSICSGPRLGKCAPCSAHQYGLAKAVLVDAGTCWGRSSVRPDVHVAVSQAVAASIAPYTRGKPVVVPNFVPAGLSERPAVPVEGVPDEPFALYAGAIGAHKGIDVLLRAWTELPAPCPLVVAALEPTGRHWPSGVTVLSLDREALISVLRRATVMVVPSIWPDPCPTTVLEAMALGVPVVASAAGGIPELLTDGVEGRLVPPGDPQHLNAAIRQVVDDPSRRQAMGIAARARAASYSVSAVAGRIEDVYRQAIDVHSVRAGRE
jgi:glycosyltransferase involved in cell wall biosynthesis